ncbi:CLUMA_CG004552, isoform A [Clunio marinus]|uniref:CLUMA_CG004552, isoform A n=1 Tax=Clunio marinus TaxID=568069 RepID=A0A1J1HWG5_9DIPT|nr:CLUMA_CG004552, isoform A [Clunio marinus]
MNSLVINSFDGHEVKHDTIKMNGQAFLCYNKKPLIRIWTVIIHKFMRFFMVENLVVGCKRFGKYSFLRHHFFEK